MHPTCARGWKVLGWAPPPPSRYDDFTTCPIIPGPTPPLKVLFLLYHYFNAKEIYNAIRVFIAAYVWMTGFGAYVPVVHVRRPSFVLSLLLLSVQLPCSRLSRPQWCSRGVLRAG